MRLQAPPRRLPAFAGVTLWLQELQRGPDDGTCGGLPADEMKLAHRFHFQQDRDRFVARRWLRRILLARWLGVAPAALHFGAGEFGKPLLVAPWGHCRFNASHSDGHALLAVCDGTEVGVDLERIRSLPDLLPLARAQCTDKEFAALLALEPSRREQAFFRAWVRKEACLKALGTGLLVEPRGVEVGLHGTASCVQVQAGRHRASLLLHSFEPLPGFVAALALRVGA